MSHKLALSGFSFTRIVVIQSLNSTDLQTGSSLYQFIDGLNDSLNTNIPVQLFSVNNSYQFIELLNRPGKRGG